MLDYTFSYADLEYFLLILVRVASFIFAAPFFSMTNTPRNVRIALRNFSVAEVVPPIHIISTVISTTRMTLDVRCREKESSAPL